MMDVEPNHAQKRRRLDVTGDNDAQMDDMSQSSFDTGVRDRDAVGLSDSAYSVNRRRMMDIANRLHSTGVQLELELPQIAVIG